MFKQKLVSHRLCHLPRIDYMQYPTKKLLDLHVRGLLQYLGKLGADDGSKAVEWNSTFAKAFGSWCRRSPADVLIQVRANLEEFQSVLPGNKPLRKLLSDLKCAVIVTNSCQAWRVLKTHGNNKSIINPVEVARFRIYQTNDNMQLASRLVLQGIFCSWRRAVPQLHFCNQDSRRASCHTEVAGSAMKRRL